MLQQVHFLVGQVLLVHPVAHPCDVSIPDPGWLPQDAPCLGESGDRRERQGEPRGSAAEQLALLWLHSKFHDRLI